MSSGRTINVDTLNCNTINADNSNFCEISQGTMCTPFNNSSDSYLKNASFFQVKWPKNCYWRTIRIHTLNSIVSGTDTDDTLLSVSDDKGNALVGSDTNVQFGVSGTATNGDVIANNNSSRTEGGILSSFNQTNDYAKRTSSEDRIITGVVYHSANGNTSGTDGDTITGSPKIFAQVLGFRLNNLGN